MNCTMTLLVALAIGAASTVAHADMFDGMLDRLGKAVENRTQQLGKKVAIVR